MYIITVHFQVKPDRREDFRAAMAAQAENSVQREPGCHQFDVCEDPADPSRVFLYEVYTDQAAFDAHLASEHFKQFDETVRNWLDSKEVGAWTRVAAPSGA